MIVPYRFLNIYQKVRNVQYGPCYSPVEILVHDKEPSTIYVSAKLKYDLCLNRNVPVHVEINGDNCKFLLSLGVFIAGFEQEPHTLGERTPIFEKMSKSGEQMGFHTIFFGHQHLNQNGTNLNGYQFIDEKWIQTPTKLPSIIYNRIPNRQTEHHPDIIKAKKLIQHHAFLFNQGFFNKWEVHESLIKNPDCSFLLPETVLHPSKQRILSLLNKHPVYIKPIHGSKGDGIIKCLLLKSGELECHYYLNDKPQVNRYRYVESFFSQHFPNGLKGYVAQQGISLFKKGKSPIDFRVHVNKNHKNSWEVTLICAKFAGKGSLTTHVKRGGKLLVLSELFSKEEEKKVSDRLTKMALLVASCLEITKPSVGEIGLDFGIDLEGRIWLFEANSKPGYSVFEHPLIAKQMEEILSFPYKYAFYLFNTRQNK
ncbi:YheC/YheD family protein [Sediminibacillus massiliensis]|uniref:YheC/YheD family endospore coat-associated protein n=1 Tax=Sediminibacillus massiliensis TaxID=1926277 RepID=UPI0015C3E316|nr:YheC/YheD family protein [Sediminibacillus massiliensis]